MLEGIITSLITPYKPNQINEIDTGMLSRLVVRQLDAQINGLLLFSLTGEGILLSDTEKADILQTVKKEVDLYKKDISIIADCTDSSTFKVIESAKLAYGNGATAVLVSPPFGIICSKRAVFDHLITVANSVSLPVIICNDPARTGIDISTEDLVRLGEHENIISICEAGNNAEHILLASARLKEKVKLLALTDTSALTMMSAGSNGIISIASNSIPEMFVNMFNIYKSSTLEDVLPIQYKLLGLAETLLMEPGPGSIKAVLNLMGLSESLVRQPFAWPLRPVLYKLAAEMDKLGIKITSGDLS